MTMSTMYATKRILMWVLWGTTLLIAPSAQAHESHKEMHAFKTHVQPRIDGVLDDECWKIATPSTEFILIEPHEGVAATNQTFIRILYDVDYLYIGLDMIDEEPSNIEGRMVNRDGRFAPLDLVGLVLDTYHDHQNAYGFYINAYGIQNDFRVQDDGAGGWGGIDQSWDGVWQSETHLHDRGWSAELAIPFKTLRFPEYEQHTWGLNVQRIARTYTENSNWAFISRDVRYLLKVSKAGHLHGIGRIKQGLHLETLPYATGRYEKLRDQPAEGWAGDLGLDLKYGIASNLTLDATLNPDFAHIEADENQINLTRFELFLKEKRPFFLEGQKLFTPMDLFYSRRISDPDVGSKVTGKIGKNSVGLIAARNRQADGDKPHFGVLRLKRDLGINSSIGALAVGKDGSLGQQAVGSDLVLSLDENAQLFLSSAMSFGADVGERNRMHTGRLRRSSDRLPFGIWASWIDPGFNVDQIGFIPRDADVGTREFGIDGSYALRPHFFGIKQIYLGQGLVAEKRTNEAGWEWQWSNVDVYVRRWDDSRAWFSHDNWQLQWQQNTYNGDSFQAGFDTGNGRKYRIRLIGQLRDQYDFADDYFGDIRLVSGTLWFNLWKGFFFDASTESVWEYFPSGALDEVKRVLLLRTTYFFHRDFFVRSFFQRSFHEDTLDLNLLLSHRFGVNDSRFYIAYNEHRAKDEAVERVLLTKISYMSNF